MIRQQRRKEKDEDARVRRAYQTPQEPCAVHSCSMWATQQSTYHDWGCLKNIEKPSIFGDYM
jgi:hypothetical protein